MKTILFVCVENSCRSQMAEGFARRLGAGLIEAYSAGSRPSGKINLDVIVVMKEIGIEITGQYSKGFTELPVKHFDYVVTMGCQDTCPFVPASEHIDWDIPDPKGKGLNEFRQVRDEIGKRVGALIRDFTQI